MLPGLAIIRLISSGEGMPGVGVRPGFIPFFSCSGLGIPGVGVVPFGSCVAPFAEIPGALAGGVIGSVESPGGRFALSRVTKLFALLFALTLAFRFALEFVAEPPQPANSPTVASKVVIKNLSIQVIAIRISDVV